MDRTTYSNKGAKPFSKVGNSIVVDVVLGALIIVFVLFLIGYGINPPTYGL